MLFSISVMAQFNFDPFAANQAAYNQGFGQGCFIRGMCSLSQGEYDMAFKSFSTGTQYTSVNWSGLGICYELGLGTSKNYVEAYKCYTKGANKGDPTCKYCLQRIAKDGYMSEEEGEIYLEYIRANINTQPQNFINNGGSSMGSFNFGGSGSSGTTQSRTQSISCSQCYGTGNCSICHGSGLMDLIYTGNQTQCTICRGTGRCTSCRGTGQR